MQHRNTSRRSGALLLIASLLLAMVLGLSCGNEQPADDLDYLVREVCRQVTVEGMTADRVSGILHDASRHGAVMKQIDAECGDDIAAVFTRTPANPQPRD